MEAELADPPPQQEQEPARLTPLNWLKATAGKLALLAGSLGILAAGLELATRAMSSVTSPLFRNHPTLGNTFRPNFADDVFVPESARAVHLRFNREGVRGPDWIEQKPPGTWRIAILGDSMMAAVATDEDKTAAAQLQKLLNESHQGQAEVLNFGISGYSTGQELVMYREIVRKYEPDVVLCAFCVLNDFGDNSKDLTKLSHRVYFDVNDQDELVPLPFSVGRAGATAWLNEHSRFYVWQKHTLERLVNRAKQRSGVLPKSKLIFSTEPDATVEHAWKITEKLILTLRDEVEADGRQFGLVVLPPGDQVYDEAWQENLELAKSSGVALGAAYPDERFRRFGETHGVDTLLLTDEFRAAAPHHSLAHGDEWLHYGGSGHFNDAGNRLLAERMGEFLMSTRRVELRSAVKNTSHSAPRSESRS